jgi:transcriptional regulator with XRE-family HTH domain
MEENAGTPNRLRELRIRSRLNQTEVATLLGVTPAVVSRHETGVKRLSHDAVIKYARLYKVWSYELFRELGEEAAGPNRLCWLRRRSRLTVAEVSGLTGIDPERITAQEEGEASITHEEILTYSKLYKVWTYEMFQRPIQGEDAWTEDARFIAEEGRALATVEER